VTVSIGNQTIALCIDARLSGVCASRKKLTFFVLNIDFTDLWGPDNET